MTISRLLMPALTLAGALALAGCGGGSSTPTTTGNGENGGGGGNGCNAPNINDGDDCLTPVQYRAKIAKEVEEENKRTEAAKKEVADASALYARLVTAEATAATSGGGLLADTALVAPVTSGTKAEHKGIHTLRGEGQTWVYAVLDSEVNSGGTPQIAANIGEEISSGDNAGYYPIDGDGALTVKAAAFTQRVGLEHKTGASFSGEFMGVQGTFKCTGAGGCTSSPATGEDMFDLYSGDDAATNKWLFKPNDRMARLQGDVVAQWGWWMAAKGEGDDAVAGAGAINLHRSGSGLMTARGVFPAAGEATYTGKALGQYAVVDGADSESGAFEATASLTAKFDGNDDTTLGGRIHDFNVGSGWEVKLKENDAEDGFIGRTVWKTNDEDGLGEGHWRASVYGGTDDAATEPTHVAGGFTATDAGASMIGAFGGEPPKQE